MEPAVPRDSHVVVKPFPEDRPRDLARGEIVAYRLPADSPIQGEAVIRILALAGDRIKMANGQVFLNGVALAEPYAVWGSDAKRGLGGKKDLAEMIVPDGHVFLLGDNREVALDSRYYGTLPETAVTGRVVWQY